MATTNSTASSKSKPIIPHKERFDLPEVLNILEPLGCFRQDLHEYLRTGKLRAVCYPYRLEPDREVQIEPDEWPAWFREPWEFSVYADHIGEMDIAEHQTPIPLHIVPRAAKADTKRKLADGKPAATTATVYVRRAELQRFARWLQKPSKSRPGLRRPGAGRPVDEKYREIYTKIDQVLEELYLTGGRWGFERPGDVVAHVRDRLGKVHLPPDSTLRNHIDSWLDKRSA